MRKPQHRSHFVFAILMATILALPIFGLLAESAVGQAFENENQYPLSPEQKDIWTSGVVTGALLCNSHLNRFAIRAQAVGNTATLRGNVSTEAERELAEQITLNVPGIEEVDNEIDIIITGVDPARTNQMPALNFSDAAVTTRVKSQLLANQETSGLDIAVNTDNGVVTLTGAVESDVDKELVYYIARNTESVRQVVNKLEVEP